MTTYNVYRRNTMSDTPVAIATGLTSKSYSDTTVTKGNTYLYSVGAVKNGTEKISSEIQLIATAEYNPSWENVLSIVLADAATFPSSAKVDKKGIATFTSTNSPMQVAQTAFNTGGAFLCDKNAMMLEMSHSSYAFALTDFVVEAKVLLDAGAIAQAPTFTLIKAGSIYGETGRSIDLACAAGVLKIATRPADAAGTSTSYSTGVSLDAGRKYHLAIMRKSGVFYFFLDGVLVYTLNESINLTVNKVRLGQGGSANSRYLNSIRISKEAFYPVAGFTPPESYPLL